LQALYIDDVQVLEAGCWFALFTEELLDVAFEEGETDVGVVDALGWVDGLVRGDVDLPCFST
jgi:hypothetical protein